MRFPASLAKRVGATYLALFGAVVWHYFPTRTDPPEAIHFQPTPEQQEYYNLAFDPQQARYERIAAEAAERFGIRHAVEGFVSEYGLENSHVLEVGSGAGSLQDVVRDYTGHGVGPAFHTGLVVPHYDAAPGYDTLIEPGMVFTIEPMLNLGTPDWVMWDDDWTVLTADGRRSAQFEHTLLVTDTGAEILTLP